MKSQIRSYRDLEVWKEGMDIVPRVYSLTAGFPEEEKYGLANQTRRAAISIPANIAEGWSRPHRKEYAHFVGIALGSTAEVQTLVLLGQRLGYVGESEMDAIDADIERIRAKLIRLHASLKSE